MPLDLRGFTTPEQQFEGLGQAANSLQREKAHEYQRQKDADTKRMASGKFLADYLDPSQHLTGTNYDPEIVKSLTSLLQHGSELVNQGADVNTLMMTLAPQVNKISEYSQKAKLIADQKKEVLNFVKNQKGIDPIKFSQAFDDAAFYETDEKGGKKLKDISKIDPNQSYGDVVLRTAEVFNNEGLSEWVRTSGKEKVVKDLKVYDAAGSLRHTKGEYTAPNYMVSETDARGAHIGFVPAYDIATDDGNPLMHDFQTEKGTVKAPVRMVKDSVWNSITPNGRAYILQEARAFAKENKRNVSDKQVENFAKALAYNEIKESGKLSSTVSELVENKPSAPQVRINLTGSPYKVSSGSGGGTKTETEINDIFKEIKEKGAGKKNGIPMNELSMGAQSVLLSHAKNATGNNDVSIADVYIRIDGNDSYSLVSKKGTLIAPLDYKMNIKAQPTAKGKTQVIENAGKQETKPTISKWDKYKQ